MSLAADTISVVIPSRNRPALVGRAVASALRQTWDQLEVIVIVDGPDASTAQVLSQIRDPRLHVTILPASGGAQAARNTGVRLATGAWIAFLDDDDEWLPEKLALQLTAARNSGLAHPIVSCGLIERAPAGDTIWPKRGPAPSESVANYLFLRKLDEMREIRLQTSTLLTTRALLVEVPWRKCPNDEWDLLLRAGRIKGAGLAYVDQPLAIWHYDAGTVRLSNTGLSWRRNGEWFASVRDLVGPEAYASFLLATLSTWARGEGDWPAFINIPLEAIRHGRPRPADLLTHAGRWLVPKALRGFTKQVALGSPAPSQ